MQEVSQTGDDLIFDDRGVSSTKSGEPFGTLGTNKRNGTRIQFYANVASIDY